MPSPSASMLNVFFFDDTTVDENVNAVALSSQFFSISLYFQRIRTCRRDGAHED